MRELDEEQFFLHTRMSKSLFYTLLNIVGSSMLMLRQRITPDERLAITIQYLAQGTSFQQLAWMHKIGKTTVRNIVLETCEVLWRSLEFGYVSEPSESQYQHIAEDFFSMWNMPNCLGALDGKHVAIKCPPKSGSAYFNYKKFISIVLMAACDANYTFIAVSVGSYGSESDGGILGSMRFGQQLLNESLPVPTPRPLPNSRDGIFPYFFVGDAAFPLMPNLMCPYSGSNLEMRKLIFNYRLSRARRVVENGFRILTARWRILKATIAYSPENAERIVLASVALHNYIMLSDASRYCPAQYADAVSGGWRSELEQNGGQLHSLMPRLASNSSYARNLRNKLTEYFSREGQLTSNNKWSIHILAPGVSK